MLLTTYGQVRTDESGSFLYLGRANNVVKIRGIKVDLEGVERSIARLDHVVDTAVAVAVRLSGSLTDDGSAKSVVAFVKLRTMGERRDHSAKVAVTVPSSSSSGSLLANANDDVARGILDHLRGVLPAAAVPARVMFVDALPLSHNGKTDRLALVRWWSRHIQRGGDASRAPAPSPADLPDWPTAAVTTAAAAATTTAAAAGSTPTNVASSSPSLTEATAAAAASEAHHPCSTSAMLLRNAANEIAAVWRRRLGLDTTVAIGYTTVFAECGGDSVALVGVISDIHCALGCRVSLSDTPKKLTLGWLAEEVIRLNVRRRRQCNASHSFHQFACGPK